ncbi:MAG: glucosamine--fructose-6-phosphate aminotransferase [Gammaproteobacteria bacterium]|nr:glucosamine--fructose-6-phosphate aminotransferase [Gammaproteobacteria bacterium]
MPKLIHALDNWGSDAFSLSLKAEIKKIRPGILPLDKGTMQGGMVDDSDLSVTVINFSEEADTIRARVGVFFTEIVGGCSCGDDPLAVNAYCELQVIINKQTADAEFSAVPG